MKILDKITLILFSIIMLVVSVVLVLLIFSVISFDAIEMLYTQMMGNQIINNVVLGIALISIVLATKAIFFGTETETNKMSGDGVLLQNEAGKLLISRETIENLVNSVAKDFENTQSVTTKVVVDNENALQVFVTLMVLPNTVINELSMNLQNKIKEVVKKVTDLDIKSIDIKIKNITTPVENKEN